jgi:hypothetical protein
MPAGWRLVLPNCHQLYRRTTEFCCSLAAALIVEQDELCCVVLASWNKAVGSACLSLRIVELTLLSTPACISCAKEHIPVRATPETAGSYSQLLVASGRRLFIGTSREGRHKPEFSAAASIETAFNSPHAKAYACQPSVI